MLSSPRIIVGTDLSPQSDRALKAAEIIRRKSHGSIQLIHVAGYPDEWDWLTNDVVANYLPPNFKNDLVKSVKKEMDEQIRRCEATAAPEIVFGKSYSSFLTLIEERKPDLVVIGKHGKKGLEKLLGSFSSRVASSASRPVMVMNDDFQTNEIIGLVDASEPTKSVYSVTEELGLLFAEKTAFLTVAPDPRKHLPTFTVSREYTEEEKTSLLASMRERIAAEVDSHVNARIITAIASEKSVPDAILDKLREENAGLAVVGRHQRNAVEKFFLGSVARRILEQCSCNILVLPPEKK